MPIAVGICILDVSGRLAIGRSERLSIMPLDIGTEFPGDIHATVGPQLDGSDLAVHAVDDSDFVRMSTKPRKVRL